MRQKGFTLIEMIIYTAILSIIIVAISSFVIWAIETNIKAKAIRETLDNVRRAMEVMTYEIKEAKSVYLPQTTSTQLSLETTKYLPQGENVTYIDFYLATSTLYFKKEAQNPIALTSDRVEVKNLIFTQISTTSTVPSLRIDLEVGYKNPSGRPEYSSTIKATSTVSIRSY